MQRITQWLSHVELALLPLVPGLVLLICGGLFIFLVTRLLGRALQRSHLPLSMDSRLLIRRGSASALWVVLVLLVLRNWGINVDGIWTMLASILAVIGVGLLAVWTMVSNITASFFIWIWRPYHLGEHIEILPDGLKGRAVDRSMMFTAIEEEDGSILMVPNNLIFQRIIRRRPDGRGHAVDELQTKPLQKDKNAAGGEAGKL